jgi:O-antigen/teichoic acid export membrane protein
MSGRDDLKGLVVRGAGWMMASQMATQVLGLITAIVVARFLGPREVGLAAEALVFGSLALVLVDFGFASAVVQRPNLSPADISTIFWAGLGLGIVLTFAGVALSWPIADLYGEPEVQPLFAVLSLAFLFTAPGIVQGALLAREMKFRSLEIRTIVATAASCAVGIGMALAGAGPWAIIGQHLVITSVSTALLWRASAWRPQAIFSIESLRSMAAYTSNVFGTRVLIWASINLDNFLVGKFAGAGALGAYSIAFNLMSTPLKRIASPLTSVLFPAFSRMRDPERIGPAWLRAVGVMAAITVPITLGVIPVAPELIGVLFGDEWDAAIPLLQILAGVGLIHSLAALNDGVLQALDRTGILFRFTAFLSIVSVAAFAVAVQSSVEAVAWAYLAVTILFQPVLLWFTAREAHQPVSAWFRSVSGVFQAGVVMTGAVVATRLLLDDSALPDGLKLLIFIAVGAAVYLPLVVWRAPDVVAEAREAWRRRRATEPGAAGGDIPLEETPGAAEPW